jgi:DhnA family fructose-bisphosphate aldolase class Ia
VGSVKARMHRLFKAESGGCFDVAVDHGFFGEGSSLNASENMKAAVATLVDANPNGIQLTQGQARLMQEKHGGLMQEGHGGRERPALAMRTDVANVYGAPLRHHMFSLMIPEPALKGMQLDAACISQRCSAVS